MKEAVEYCKNIMARAVESELESWKWKELWVVSESELVKMYRLRL
jgi:hypothetical protein